MKKNSIFTLITGFILAGIAHAESLKNSKPNIIFVMTDDQGMGDLSCMGNKILKTPNIDKFYKGATRFTEYHVSPTCAPTRAALMSGRTAFKNGVTHTIFQRERMALDSFTLPQALQTAGYQTGLFGKWHLGDDHEYLPQSRGFNEVLMHGAGGIGQTGLGDFLQNGKNVYFDNVLLHNDTVVKTKGFCTDIFFDAGLAWIKKQHEAKQPYFAYISLNAPHGPFIAPESYMKSMTARGVKGRGIGRLAMIENIDDNFGRLMEKLTKWNALDNTIVIFTTDNGAVSQGRTKDIPYFNAGMRGGKNSSWEGGTHVPLFIQWKGILQPGVDINGLSAHIDIYKTFVELAGAKLPEKMQELDGRSLVPLLENPTANWKDRELFFNCGRWAKGKRDEFKYTKCAVRSQQWRLVNHSQLFDISKDPGEATNVAKEHPEVVARLQKAYDQWWESTLPLMVNEGLPKIKGQNQPFNVLYQKQLKEKGIPEWTPDPS